MTSKVGYKTTSRPFFWVLTLNNFESNVGLFFKPY